MKEAVDYGIINLDDVRMKIKMAKIKEALDKHPYKIFECNGSWMTYFPDKEKGRVLKKRKNREDLENLIVEFQRKEVMNPTIKELFCEWNAKRMNDGDIAHSGFCRNEDYYNRHFAEMGKRRIKDITIKEWATFMKKEACDKKLKLKAYQGLHGVAFGMLKYAKEKDLISYRISEIDEYISFGKNFFRRNRKVEDNKELEEEISDEKEVYSEEELNVLLPYLMAHRDAHNFGILLEFIIGPRGGEVAALKNSCVKDNFVMIRRSETRGRIASAPVGILEKEDTIIGKTYYYAISNVKSDAGERDVVFPKGCEWICDELRKLNPNGEYVFVNKQGKRMTTNCFRKRLKRICNNLGIVPKPPHKLRKTYVSILGDARVDDNLTKRQVGHVKLLKENYHKDRKSKTIKAEILGNIPDFDILKIAE